MSITEVMQELGLSRPTIYKRIKAGRLVPLPKQNPNRDIEPLRFLRADVERLKQAAAPTAPKE